MRLIDATEAATWARIHILDSTEKYAILDFLRECTTIDAVPVVRCKDCKFQRTMKCPTYHITYFSEKESWELDGEDDFCSY